MKSRNIKTRLAAFGLALLMGLLVLSGGTAAAIGKKRKYEK